MDLPMAVSLDAQSEIFVVAWSAVSMVALWVGLWAAW